MPHDEQIAIIKPTTPRKNFFAFLNVFNDRFEQNHPCDPQQYILHIDERPVTAFEFRPGHKKPQPLILHPVFYFRFLKSRKHVWFVHAFFTLCLRLWGRCDDFSTKTGSVGYLGDSQQSVTFLFQRGVVQLTPLQGVAPSPLSSRPAPPLPFPTTVADATAAAQVKLGGVWRKKCSSPWIDSSKRAWQRTRSPIQPGSYDIPGKGRAA